MSGHLKTEERKFAFSWEMKSVSGHLKVVSRCRLVGSGGRPGGNFFTSANTFARLTQSQAISQSIAFLSLFRSMRDSDKFLFLFIF